MLKAVRFPTANHAVAHACGVELASFLLLVGYGRDRIMPKVTEMLPDVETIVARDDDSAIMVSFDGSAVRLFVSKGKDDSNLFDAEEVATKAGHSLYGIIPSRIRQWLQENMGDWYARPH